MIRKKTEKLVMASVFLALGILVPQLFHLFPMANTGGVLLPMHIPVILCGIVVGSMYGMFVGALAPIFSSMLTGMPNAVRLPFMVCELMIYGMVVGIVYKLLLGMNKMIRVYIALGIAMICGRISYFLAIGVAINMFGVKNMTYSAVIDALVLGIPGIIMQLILIPVMITAVDMVMAGKSKKLLGKVHTFVCRNKNILITSDKKGIAPIMDILNDNPAALKGAKITDRVIGKAAALLLIKGRISSLHTDVISCHALKVLKNSDIRVFYNKKVEYIINRNGDDMCPMEKATINIDNPDKAYTVLIAKLEELKKMN